MRRNWVKFLVLSIALASIPLLGFSSYASAQTKFNGKDPFPKKLKKSGSYLQVTNITIPAKNTTSDAVDITASNVTVDLQGYTISGPGAGTGVGINASGMSNVTIQNGIIVGMGGPGIILGPNSVVRNVQVINNGGDGIDCGPSCLITSSVISGNTGTGLNFSTDTTSGYSNNVIQGTTPVVGGTNLGANVCNGGACP
jgi:hypothetical protein